MGNTKRQFPDEFSQLALFYVRALRNHYRWLYGFEHRGDQLESTSRFPLPRYSTADPPYVYTRTPAICQTGVCFFFDSLLLLSRLLLLEFSGVFIFNVWYCIFLPLSFH